MMNSTSPTTPTATDWQIGLSMSECMRHMLEHEIACDVTICIGEDMTPLRAHNMVLSARSPVFDRMLNGAFREAREGPVLPDMDVDTFRTVLRFCYYDCCDVPEEFAFTTLCAAKEYMLPILEEAARKVVINNINNTNIIDILKYSKDVNEDTLYDGCIQSVLRGLGDQNFVDLVKYSCSVEDELLHGACMGHTEEHLTSGNFVDLVKYSFDIGDKELHKACLQTIPRNMDSGNFVDLVKYSFDIGDKELHKACLQTIPRNMDSGNFVDLVKYSFDIGDKELHGACTRNATLYLNDNNVIDLLYYSLRAIDLVVNMVCIEYLSNHLSVSTITKAFEYALQSRELELLTICKSKLSHQFLGSNVWDLYQLSVAYDEQEVTAICRRYFQQSVENVRNALQDDAFLAIPHEVLLDFLHINDVFDEMENVYDEIASSTFKKVGGEPDNNMETQVSYETHYGILISEIKLFKACNAWAEANCVFRELDPTGFNKRTALGECLFLLRFQTMLQEDLVDTVKPTQILNEDEMTSLLLQYNMVEPNANERSLSPLMQTNFRIDRRNFVVPQGTVWGRLYLEPHERMVLERIWLPYECKCSIKISRDGFSDASIFNILNISTKCGKYIMGGHVIQYVEISPVIVLEAEEKYVITVERGGLFKFVKPEPSFRGIRIVDRGFKLDELTVTSTMDSNHWTICMLTMGLI